jgi:hypothetical protein
MGTADACGQEPDDEVTGLRDASVGGNGLRPEFHGASGAEILNAAYAGRL